MGPRFRAQNWDRKIFNFSRELSARSGFFSSPGGAKWPCPGASPGPAADQVCSSPESQSIAGPSVSYAASAVSDLEAGLTRHRTLLDAGSPSRESTAARELNKTEPALFRYSVLSPSRTTASLLEISQLLRVPACLSSSLVSPRVVFVQSVKDSASSLIWSCDHAVTFFRRRFQSFTNSMAARIFRVTTQTHKAARTSKGHD